MAFNWSTMQMDPDPNNPNNGSYPPPPSAQPTDPGVISNPNPYNGHPYAGQDPGMAPPISLPQYNVPQLQNQYATTAVPYSNNIAATFGNPAPTMNAASSTAAQIDPNAVPDPNAQQQQISPQLSQLLSGMGFTPDILAKMHATATQAPAAAGAQQMSQERLAMQNSGMDQSPAGAAVLGQIAQQTGQQQSAANSAVDVANAQQGMQNMQFGVGQQTQIGTSNMEQANQMALANANRLFTAMQQNTANQQQTAMSNAGFTQDANKTNETAAANRQAQGSAALNTWWQNQGTGAQNLTNQANAANFQNQTDQQKLPWSTNASNSSTALNNLNSQAPAPPVTP